MLSPWLSVGETSRSVFLVGQMYSLIEVRDQRGHAKLDAEFDFEA